MSVFPLSSDRVQLGVTAVGGHLDNVRFQSERGPLAPLHTPPWAHEELSPDIPPVLRMLRGDFFCAPFGDSDLLPDEQRTHGRTANGTWKPLRSAAERLELELDAPVAGATVRKTVMLRPGHPIVYQEHLLAGGHGALPLGHHVMLRADESLHLSFAPFVWGGTPPMPLEDPFVGRSRLAYPQRFESLARVQLDTGKLADLTLYPALENADDLLMMVGDDRLEFAWSAAVAPQAGWAYFAVRNPRVLRSTVLWLSNGGRDYAPWSGRHRRVIGIEDVTGFFHRGHRASQPPNLLTTAGYPTALVLAPERPTRVRYAFGVVAVPDGFLRVARIERHTDGVQLSDEAGRSVAVPIDLDYVLAQ
jgi:hypothetical protein